MEFCKCGSIIIKGKCSNEHCPEKNQKHKEWIIDGKAVGFKKPISYDEAAKFIRELEKDDK